MLGGWPDQASNSATSRRATSHVNPLPARKPSKRAKYGDAATANKERRLARSPKPPVVRPRPKRAAEYFRELIRSVEEGPLLHQQHQKQQMQQQPAPAPTQRQPQARRQREAPPPLTQSDGGSAQHPNPRPGAQGDEENTSEDSDPDPAADSHPDPIPDLDPYAEVDSGLEADLARVTSSVGTSTSSALASTATAAAAIPLPAPAAAPVGPAGFRRRRKLFTDSADGPHPRTTAKIVARLAACKHWRRQLSYKLLPRYLPLFDEHAAAYFFRRVPDLQPRPPHQSPSSMYDTSSSTRATAADPSPLRMAATEVVAPSGGGGDSFGSRIELRSGPSSSSNDAAGFRRMVVAVCCSLLPKMPSFGPRALTWMVVGLGRMGIGHGPTLTAWEVHSVPQLGLMRPDQLVASLEGLAAIHLANQTPTAAPAPAAAAAAAAARIGAGRARPRRRWRHWGGRQQQQQPQPQQLPVLGAVWREAALEAVAAALPRMTVAEVGRLLMALAALRLPPPSPELLAAACARVRTGLAEEAARLAAANGVLLDKTGRLDGGARDAAAGVDASGGRKGSSGAVGAAAGGTVAGGGGEAGGAAQERAVLLDIASALEESAARQAATPYRIGAVGAVGGAVGVVAATAAAAAAAATAAAKPGPSGKAKGRAGEAAGRRRPAAPPEPEPVRGLDVARVVRGLGALGCTAPSADWLAWMVGEIGEVMRWQLRGERAQQHRQHKQQQHQRAASSPTRAGARLRQMVAAGAAAVEPLLLTQPQPQPREPLPVPAQAGGARTTQTPTLTQAQAAPTPPPTPFFSAEDLAELAAGLADLMPALAAQASPATATAVPSSEAAATPSRERPPGAAPSPPPPVPAEWLDLLLEAALDDVRRRLDPANAAAAAAAAAAADAMAILTRGDVTKADAAAVAAAAGTAAAAAAAAADAVTAASCLLAALLQLLPYYTPPRHWCFAAAGVGLDLVPYMPPPALLLWLRSLAAWGLPRPLPPAWHAAAAVSSRTRLRDFSGQQLCELPGVLTAAGARMPAAWAAHYVRHLASRLAARPDGSQMYGATQPLAASESGKVPSRRRHARWGRWREGAWLPKDPRRAAAAAARRRLRLSRGGGGGREGTRADVALADAAAALKSLPYAVPDLRYAGEVERDALQALARAFGLETRPEPPAPQSAPWKATTEAAAAAAAAATAPPGGRSEEAPGDARLGAVRRRGVVSKQPPPPLRQRQVEERQAVVAFLAAAGWAGGAA